MIKILSLFLLLASSSSRAALREVESAFQNKQFFSAARIAFNESQSATTNTEKAWATYWTTKSLVSAGLDQASFYFFLRTLTFKSPQATKAVLEFTPFFVERVGPDLLRKTLTKMTTPNDFSNKTRSALWVLVAKEKLFKGDYSGSVTAASQVATDSASYPLALQIRGTARVFLNEQKKAIVDFRECARKSDQRVNDWTSVKSEKWDQLLKDAARDLKARCLADQARALYEIAEFDEADRIYDRIPKASFVWTDTLFEHAWATFAREEYNRTLGKLVSYKSPALSFVFNSEIEVLTAQSYMALCLFDDALKVLSDFDKQYAPIAKDVKNWVESSKGNVFQFYETGKSALALPLSQPSGKGKFLNRLVRTPYFQVLVLSEERAIAEKLAIGRLDAMYSETKTGSNRGFPGFLNKVLDWRIKMVQTLGGIYVRNSAIDYHAILIQDFEKVQYMKIDLLAHKKEKLLEPEVATAKERKRGNRIPKRRDHQILWNFNGEFWNDEIGDYVFALDSKCTLGVPKDE